MTAEFDKEEGVTYILIQHQKNQERRRPRDNLKNDPSLVNPKSKWPEENGAFGKLWAKTEKGDIDA